MTDTQTEDVRYDKVRKLLNKAEGAGTEEEADAFFTKAQELITRWMLDDAKLAATTTGPQEQLVNRRIKIATTYKHPDQALLMGIAKINDCQVYGFTNSPDINLFGFQGDVDRTVFMYTTLQLQSARDARKARQDPFDYSKPYIFKRSFRLGFAHAVVQRLKESRQATQEAAVREDNSLLPVLASRQDRVLDEFRQQNPNLRSSRGGRGITGSFSGREAGAAAGARADIGSSRVGGGNRGAIG